MRLTSGDPEEWPHPGARVLCGLVSARKIDVMRLGVHVANAQKAPLVPVAVGPSLQHLDAIVFALDDRVCEAVAPVVEHLATPPAQRACDATEGLELARRGIVDPAIERKRRLSTRTQPVQRTQALLQGPRQRGRRVERERGGDAILLFACQALGSAVEQPGGRPAQSSAAHLHQCPVRKRDHMELIGDDGRVWQFLLDRRAVTLGEVDHDRTHELRVCVTLEHGAHVHAALARHSGDGTTRLEIPERAPHLARTPHAAAIESDQHMRCRRRARGSVPLAPAPLDQSFADDVPTRHRLHARLLRLVRRVPAQPLRRPSSARTRCPPP